MEHAIEFEQETDGRWIAEIPAVPGAMVYAASKEEATTKVRNLALRILSANLS
jgi:predicted RNase H-like HicB family nuclease